MSNNLDKIHHIYFKQDDNKYIVYDPYTNYGTFKTVEHKEYRQIKKHYKMLAGYEASDAGLIAYYKDFKIWNQELYEHYKTHKSHLTFFYFKDSNDLNIIETFYNFSRHIYDFKSNKYDGNAREFFRFKQVAKETINSEGNDILESTHVVPYINRHLLQGFYNGCSVYDYFVHTLLWKPQESQTYFAGNKFYYTTCGE